VARNLKGAYGQRPSSIIDLLGAISSFLWPGATSARFGGCSTGLVRFQFGVNGRDEEDARVLSQLVKFLKVERC
jgi:hypothetical protein